MPRTWPLYVHDPARRDERWEFLDGCPLPKLSQIVRILKLIFGVPKFSVAEVMRSLEKVFVKSRATNAPYPQEFLGCGKKS